MKAQEAPTAQSAASLLQVASLRNLELIPASAKMTIAAFLEQGSDNNDNVLLQDLGSSDDMGAPAANALESSSGGVVAMLDGLQKKFIDEQTTLQTSESNQQGAHALLTQDLKAQLEQTRNDKAKRTLAKSKRTSDKVDRTEDK